MPAIGIEADDVNALGIDVLQDEPLQAEAGAAAVAVVVILGIAVVALVLGV